MVWCGVGAGETPRVRVNCHDRSSCSHAHSFIRDKFLFLLCFAVLCSPEELVTKLFAGFEYREDRPLVFQTFCHRVALFAIDEAHLVQQWGVFRGDFAGSTHIRRLFPRVPILVSCSISRLPFLPDFGAFWTHQ